jgi:hypothetical protein
MTAPIFHDPPDEVRPDALNDEVSRRASLALARFERLEVIGAGEGRGVWGDIWLLPAVGQWRVLAVESCASGATILIALGARAGLPGLAVDSAPLWVVIIGLVAFAVSVSWWAKASLGGWVDDHNARVRQIRREAKAALDRARELSAASNRPGPPPE